MARSQGSRSPPRSVVSPKTHGAYLSQHLSPRPDVNTSHSTFHSSTKTAPQHSSFGAPHRDVTPPESPAGVSYQVAHHHDDHHHDVQYTIPSPRVQFDESSSVSSMDDTSNAHAGDEVDSMPPVYTFQAWGAKDVLRMPKRGATVHGRPRATMPASARSVDPTTRPVSKRSAGGWTLTPAYNRCYGYYKSFGTSPVGYPGGAPPEPSKVYSRGVCSAQRVNTVGKTPGCGSNPKKAVRARHSVAKAVQATEGPIPAAGFSPKKDGSRRRGMVY